VVSEREGIGQKNKTWLAILCASDEECLKINDIGSVEQPTWVLKQEFPLEKFDEEG